MNKDWRYSSRIKNIKKSVIHEMTRLSKEIDDVAFLSWAKPTSTTPKHIRNAAIKANKLIKTEYDGEEYFLRKL